MYTRVSLWLWRGLWFSSILVALGLYAMYARLPADGATGDLESFTPRGFLIRRVLDTRNGLRAGDIVVRAGGHDVDEWLAGAPRGPEWRVGGTVSYEILRDGEMTTLPVRLYHRSVGTILRTWSLQLLGAIAFFAVGTFVFWKRPYALPARLLMLFGVTVALQYWGDAYNVQYTTIPFRWPLWIQTAYEHTTYSLSIATICFFAMVFPEPQPVVVRFPRGVPLVLYALHPVAILTAMALAGGWSRALAAGSHASWGMAMFQIALALVAGIRAYRTVHDPIKRAQLRWIVWTAVVGAAVLIPGYVLPLLITGRPILPHPVIMVGLSALAIVLAIVILRYRLFDIEVLIRSTLIYGTLTAILGAMYLLLIPALTFLARILLQRTDDLLTSFVATMCIVVAFNPLRRRVQDWIDRAFYRAQVDYAALLPEVSDQLATNIVFDELSAILIQELPRRLQIAWAELSIREPPGVHIHPVGEGRLPTLQVDQPAIEHLRLQTSPITRLAPPQDLPADTTALLEQHGIELLIPLTVGSDLVGLYALGPKLSGDPYNSYDIRLLRILGQQVATSLQNAQLYRRVEVYTHSLEDQVQTRTSELQEAYRDIARQHQTLNIVLDNVADGLVVTDPEGQIILHNPVFLEMVAGLSPDCVEVSCLDDQEELVGHLLRQVSPDPPLSDAVSQALQFPATVVTVDTTWEHKVYRASACALGGIENPTSGVVTVLRDITQEVEMAQLKDEFVSMVSHELRTPLTSIIGFTHLIDRSFRSNIQPHISRDDRDAHQAAQRVLNNIEIIIGQGERLTRLINNILDLSRIEAGHTQWEMRRLQISEVIEHSVDATGSLARERGLAIETHVESDLPPVYGDHDRLVQVMTNLLSNAIKFTDRGEVRISAWRLDPGDNIMPFSTRQPNIELALPASETYVAVSVQDTGTGIAEADLPHVFERFRQVGDRMSGTRRPGTGLGLPICRGIVEHHGGQIWVESQLGIGSHFVFTLRAVDTFGAQ